jgi:hypothetical protein
LGPSAAALEATDQRTRADRMGGADSTGRRAGRPSHAVRTLLCRHGGREKTLPCCDTHCFTMRTAVRIATKHTTCDDKRWTLEGTFSYYRGPLIMGLIRGNPKLLGYIGTSASARRWISNGTRDRFPGHLFIHALSWPRGAAGLIASWSLGWNKSFLLLGTSHGTYLLFPPPRRSSAVVCQWTAQRRTHFRP